MKDLSYADFSMQNYLTSDKIHPGKAKILFLSRTRMLKVKNNFRHSHADLNCPLCSGEENNGIKFLDDQHHLLHCVKLVDATPAVPGEKCCNYRDIFSDNIDAMSAVADIIERSLTKREELLKK